MPVCIGKFQNFGHAKILHNRKKLNLCLQTFSQYPLKQQMRWLATFENWFFEIAPITRHQCRSRSDPWPRYISSGTPWIFLPQKWRALPGRTARQTAPSPKSHVHWKREKHFYNFTLFIFRIFFLGFHTNKSFMNLFDDSRQLRKVVGVFFHSLR